MKRYIKIIFCLLIVLVTIKVNANKKYQYSVDLTKTEKDKLKVELICPKTESNTITFNFPSVIPGSANEIPWLLSGK